MYIIIYQKIVKKGKFNECCSESAICLSSTYRQSRLGHWLGYGSEMNCFYDSFILVFSPLIAYNYQTSHWRKAHPFCLKALYEPLAFRGYW
jgi:hypothetical protein